MRSDGLIQIFSTDLAVYFMLSSLGGLMRTSFENTVKITWMRRNTFLRFSISSLFDHFNFDMLKAMVEEMNRYGEAPDEVLELLNAKPEYGASSSFKIQMFVDDKCLKKEHVNDGNDIWKGNPLKEVINLYCIPDPDNHRYQHIKCTMKDLKHVNSDNGEYVFVTSDNMRLVLRKEEESHKMDYNMVLDPKAANP